MLFAGSFLGWLIITGLVLALLNYPIKKLNRALSRRPADDRLRKVVAAITRVITSRHRWFALTALLALIAHLILQSISRWVSLSGLTAALLLLANGMLGAFGHYVRKRRRGPWFVVHRTFAVLLVLAIAAHVALLGLPALVIGGQQPQETTESSAALTTEPSVSETEQTFTLDELAHYNGQNGQPAYVAVDRIVYDVSDLARWMGGEHMNLHTAGKDLTDEIAQSPHGKAMLSRAKRVGILVTG